jgi:hypothetical protein
MPSKTAPSPNSIDQTIRKNLTKLRKPGVLTVRPGYEIAGHQLTGKRAIVATVHTKKVSLPKSDLLPNSIDGIPVDVREASPYQRLRKYDPASADLAQAYGRPETKIRLGLWRGKYLVATFWTTSGATCKRHSHKARPDNPPPIALSIATLQSPKFHISLRKMHHSMQWLGQRL